MLTEVRWNLCVVLICIFLMVGLFIYDKYSFLKMRVLQIFCSYVYLTIFPFNFSHPKIIPILCVLIFLGFCFFHLKL